MHSGVAIFTALTAGKYHSPHSELETSVDNETIEYGGQIVPRKETMNVY